MPIIFPFNLIVLCTFFDFTNRETAHCGTALSGGSMTLSVGCRAPSVSDLISKLAEKLSTSTDEYAVRRYTDDDLLSNIKETNGDKTKPKEAKSLMDSTVGEVLAPGRLTSKAKDKAKHLVLESLTSMLEDDEFWDEFIGKYVTEQKRVRNNYPIPLEDWENDCDDSIEEDKNKEDNDVWGNAKSAVGSVLAGQGVLYHAEGISFAYSSCLSTKDDGVIVHRLFVNGEMWQSNSRQNARQNNMSRIFSTVANNRRLDQALLLRTHESNDGSISPSEIELDGDVIHFIEKLVSMGVLYGSDE